MIDYVEIPRLEQSELRAATPDELTIRKARETVAALNSMDWVAFIESYQHLTAVEGDNRVTAETVVFETEVELPQRLVADIRQRERIAVTFRPDDARYPGVYALRATFPAVPHLNLEAFEHPRSLCLYDAPYSDIKLTWTGTAFVERIREWLAKTATGELHQADQSLEPLLAGIEAFLILPPNLDKFAKTTVLAEIEMIAQRWDNGQLCFVARASRAEDQANKKNDCTVIFSVLTIAGEPQPHGRIARKPENLLDLHEFLKSAGIDLLGHLRAAFKSTDCSTDTLRNGLVLLVVLPKSRSSETRAVETSDVWAFVCVNDDATRKNGFNHIGEIGEDVGVWGFANGSAGFLVLPDETKNGENTKLMMLAPCATLSRSSAGVWSGIGKRAVNRLAAVGMGALGSQVFLNLLRAGDGEWTLIDKDILLPHNLVRHAAYGAAVGLAKSWFMAEMANATVEQPNIAKAIIADVLVPGNESENLIAAFAEADAILDFSASQAAARHLALDVESSARRISLFLNPAGTDLVLLAEDSERAIPLDSLEMQYYRLLINTPEFGAHLVPPAGRIRFSAACRDLSNQIPPENVALCAALGTRAVRQVLRENNSEITVWRATEDREVRKHSVAAAAAKVAQTDGWQIKFDQTLIDKTASLRRIKLPVETGGVLIGCYDTERKIIYVADALPAPPDSVEEPTHFIRGNVGLKSQIGHIEQITLGNLRYVGEWHSHPPDCSTEMGNTDRRLLASLATLQHKDGNPALILIVGEEDYSWHLA